MYAFIIPFNERSEVLFIYSYILNTQQTKPTNYMYLKNKGYDTLYIEFLILSFHPLNDLLPHIKTVFDYILHQTHWLQHAVYYINTYIYIQTCIHIHVLYLRNTIYIFLHIKKKANNKKYTHKKNKPYCVGRIDYIFLKLK